MSYLPHILLKCRIKIVIIFNPWASGFFACLLFLLGFFGILVFLCDFFFFFGGEGVCVFVGVCVGEGV